MKNKLPSTFLLFVLACVLFMAAPSQAYMIYDVEAKYDDGFSYEFAFIVSDGEVSFDAATEDKFFRGLDQFVRRDTTSVLTLGFDPSNVASLEFRFNVDFVWDVPGTNARYEAFLVREVLANVDLFGDKTAADPDFDVITSNITEGGLVVTARPTAAVPEPATLSLIALGVAGLVLLRRRVQPQLEHVIPHGTNAANA